jgi:hypothetical protein
MAVKQPTNPNPALMESLLAQARNKNLASLNEVNQAKIAARNENQESLNQVNLNRQNNPINDERAIENTLNQQRGFTREKNFNQDQEVANNPEDPVGADLEASKQSREARIGELKTGIKEGDASISETETPQTQEPQAQENNLAEKKSQAINIPGIGGPGGGMSADDLQEVTKKAIKELAKKKLIMLLAPWAPVIITVLVGGLVTIVIIFASINVYQCYEKKGITGLLWSTFWKGYGQTLSDAFSGNCIAEDTPQQETTKKETPSQTTPPPEEGETP